MAHILLTGQGGTSGGTGTSDHGSLSGLLDNDHPQYRLTATTIDFSEISSTGHTHDPTLDILSGGAIDGQVLVWRDSDSAWSAETSPAGVTDHGLLTGLGDDDHPRYSQSSHTHSYSATTPQEEFNSHTGDSTIHFTVGSLNLNQYTTDTEFDSHTGTSNIHFTEASLELAQYRLTATTIDFSEITNTGHTHTDYSTTAHTHSFTEITSTGHTHTESDISDFGTYSPQSEFNSHTGDSTIHFLTTDINYSDIQNTGHTHNPSGGTILSGGAVDGQILIWRDSIDAWSGETSPAGVTDHGLLTGLGDDDHPRYSQSGHVHSFSEITLTGHTHTESDISDFGTYTPQSEFNSHSGDSSIHFTESSLELGKYRLTATTIDFSEITNTGHTHEYSGITNTGHTHTESEISDFGDYTERTYFESHSGDSTIHFTESSLELDKYSTTAQTITHTGDSTIHFIESSIDHGSISGLLDNDHTQYRLTATTIDFSEITNTGHTHGLDDLEQDGASAGQVIAWNTGTTQWEPTDPVVATGDTTLHNSLDGLQGGQSSQYYHLNSSEWSTLRGGSSNADLLHDHSYSAITSTGHTHVESEISDLGDYAEKTYFESHSGDSTIHFTVSSLNLDQYTTDTEFDVHTGTSNIHFLTTDINFSDIQNTGHTHTESDISDFGTYTPQAEFNSHTGDSSIHFTVSSLNLDQYTTDTEFDSHTGDSTIHFLVTDVNFSDIQSTGHTHTESDISDLGDYAERTYFESHSGDSTIHFTESSIDHGNISGLSDDDHPRYSQSGHSHDFSDISNTGHTHELDDIIGEVSEAQFIAHTGDSTIHFTEDSIDIDNIVSAHTHTESEISDFGTYTPQSEFNAHSGDSTIHFGISDIPFSGIQDTGHTHEYSGITNTGHTHIESEISDLGDYAERTYFESHSGDATIHFTVSSLNLDQYTTDTEFDVHTGTTNIHFLVTDIDYSDIQNTGHTHTESDITDFGTYTPQAEFNSHTGNSDIHFTEASLNLDQYTTDTEFDVHTGTSNIHFLTTDINYSDIQNTGHTHNPSGGTILSGGAINGQIMVWRDSIDAWSGETQAAGVTDHGLLSGLDDDDHPRYSQSSHTHSFSEITSTGHTHIESDITDFGDYAERTYFESHTGTSDIHFTEASIDIDNIVSAHTHTESEISDLGTYTPQTEFNSHSGDATIHFLTTDINFSDIQNTGHTHDYSEIENTGHTHTESEISDFGTYTPQSEFNSHTGDSTIHFLTTEIDFSDIQNTGHTHDYASISHTHVPSGGTILSGGAVDGQILVWRDDINAWSGETSPAGVTDHGLLTGLDDDDHPRYSQSGHTHIPSGGTILSGGAIDGQVLVWRDSIDAWSGETNVAAGSHSSLSDMPDGAGTNTDHDTRYVPAFSASTPTTPIPYSGMLWYDTDEIAPAVVSDHGLLSGLTDDDHPRYSQSSHTHSFSTITSTGHTHVESEISDLADYAERTYFESHSGDSTIHFLTTDIDFSDIQNTGHTHIESDISDFGDYAERSYFESHTGITNIHFLTTDIDYSDIQNTGHTHNPSGGTILSGGAIDGQVLVWRDSIDAWSGETSPAGVTDHGLLNGLDDDDHPRYSQSGHTHNPSGGTILSGGAINGQILVWRDSINAWSGETSAAGVTDHGLLTGLDDDDHPRYSQSGHVHSFSEITDTGHTHTESQITDLGDYAERTYFESHSGDTDIHFTVSSLNLDQYTTDTEFDVHTGTTNIHFLTTDIEFSDIQNTGHTHTESDITDFGTYTPQTEFNSHTGDTDIHFTEASIDHGSILGLDDDDHPRYSQSGHSHTYSSTTLDSKSLTLRSTRADEDVTLMSIFTPIDVMSAHTVLVGSSTPTVTWELRYGTDRSATGTLLSSGITTSVTSIVDSYIGSGLTTGNIVWLETTATGGTVNELHVTMSYSGTV